MIRRRFTQRPDHFTVDPTVGLARGLVFAGLGGGHGSVVMRDSSPGKKNDGTLTGMDPATDWQWSEVLGRRVLDFDGVNDYVTMGDVAAGEFASGQSFSVAAWIKPGPGDTDGEFGGILIKGYTLSQQRPFWGLNYYNFYSGQHVRFILRTVAGETKTLYTASDSFPDDIATHCCIVYDASAATATAYVNGVYNAQVTSVAPAPYGTNSDPLGMGRERTAYYRGQIADPLIFNRILTPSEIQQLADPYNVMLSGLILPPRRRVWPSAVVPLALADYADVTNESPFEDDESIVTVAATGGSAPVSYSITAQSTTAGMLKVTGTLSPDAAGVYVENGTYGGQEAYERTDGSYWIWFDGLLYWYISEGKNVIYGGSWESASLTGSYSPYMDATGTATVAAYAPFQINASTGEITIADASGLAVGQTWTLTVRATDALSDTDDGTVTVELVSGAVFNPAWAARCNNLIGAGI